jgi:metal-responsive CopG/Arc/MetJ family transcriptional regulator
MRQDAIGVRLPKDVLVSIEKLSKEEHEDRSTIIRKLVMVGYADVMKEKAAERYVSGKVTLSEAAHQAGLTVWEMEQYLVGRGFKSSYSIEDLERETRLLR